MCDIWMPPDHDHLAHVINEQAREETHNKVHREPGGVAMIINSIFACKTLYNIVHADYQIIVGMV